MKYLGLIFLVVACVCLFEENLEIHRLDDKNWYAKIASSDELWAVAFYAPWDGKSKDLSTEFEKV